MRSISYNLETYSKYHLSTEQLQTEFKQIEAAKLDARQFAPLYNKYYKQIFAYIYQRMNDKEVAFDLTAQVFLKALLNIGKYEFKGVPFSSWLFRIAHNELMQLFRDKKVQRAIHANSIDVRNIFEEIEEGYKIEYQGLVIKLIKQLPEDELQLVEMRFFEKRPFKEIAEILNLTETNAKVKLYRILEKLKKVISESRKY